MNSFKYKDQIYGREISIEDLGEIVIKVINSPVFQRLFSISHGGLKSDRIHNHNFTKIPQSHTRGAHSVSTGILAHYLFNKGELDTDRVHFVLAALLHDLGHTAYSHLGEMATGICHKDYTRQLITSDEELVKIWTEHGIDAEEVAKLALEKTPGNPVTVERNSGLISLDHLNNIPFDNLARLGKTKAKAIARKTLHSAYIRNGRILLPQEEIALQSEFTNLSIAQNLTIIYNPKELLLDLAGIDYIRKLIQAGILSATDLYRTQPETHEIICSADATNTFPLEWSRLTTLIPNLSDEAAQQYVTRIPSTSSPANTQGFNTRVIDSTYLMTIPLDESDTITYPQAFKDLADQICGTYILDIEKIGLQ